MKSILKILILVFVTMLSGFIINGCLNNTEPAASTETTNGDVYGIIQTETGGPSEGTTVYLRSANYAGYPLDSVFDSSLTGGIADFRVTDKEGKFRFTLGESDSGALVVESIVNTSGTRRSFVKQPGEAHDLGALTMEPTGSISGTVQLPEGNNNGVLIQVMGTEQTLVLDPGETQYELTGLPADDYVIRASEISPGAVPQQVTANVAPGTSTPDVNIDLKIRALIVNGINWHNDALSTARLVTILENSGLFKVSVSSTPPDSSPAELWDEWRPDFTLYDVVLINYNSGVWDSTRRNPWPLEVEASFENFLSRGGGAVLTHTSFNAFGDWDEFMQFAGLAWRDKAIWPGLYIDSLGVVTTIPVNEGLNPIEIDTTALIVAHTTTHPITSGLPPAWLHYQDGIDIGLRGPAENLTVLNHTYNKNSGLQEPVDWTVDYSSGRVYANNMGHVWDQDSSMLCVGFQTMMIRGAEWAATGAVSYPVPANFPTDSTTSLADSK